MENPAAAGPLCLTFHHGELHLGNEKGLFIQFLFILHSAMLPLLYPKVFETPDGGRVTEKSRTSLPVSHTDPGSEARSQAVCHKCVV